MNDLDDDFARMQFESSSSDKKIAAHDVDLKPWNEIEPESDAEF